MTIARLDQVDSKTLGIHWEDGHKQKIDVVHLRRRCPCAACIDEVTGRKRLRPDEVSETVRPVGIRTVGTYAIQIQFSDGHHSGIYPYDMLRQMSPIS